MKKKIFIVTIKQHYGFTTVSVVRTCDKPNALGHIYSEVSYGRLSPSSSKRLYSVLRRSDIKLMGRYIGEMWQILPNSE